MELHVETVPDARRKPIPTDASELGFGRRFTDHMFLMEHDPDRGWHSARIAPYGPLTLDPAATVFHYGQEIFEGLKAYRGDDGGVYLFRHRDNLDRMNASAERLVMPSFDPEVVERALRELILLDREWIPRAEGCALYIRPTMIGIDPFLGVRPAQKYLFYIIIGPVGAYYAEGFNPVSICVCDTYVRAVKGGMGEAKTGGNYAGSLAAQAEAKAKGYAQVLWLDAIERKYVEEVGTMNIFFRFRDEVVTSPLTGTILPGVTRASVLQLLRDWDLPVRERMIAIDEVIEGARSGELLEVFGTGTAAIISPVKTIAWHDEDVPIGDGTTGELSQRLYDTLLGIQYGRLPDPHGWVERIG